MENYLLELSNDNNTVIIPNLGAVIVSKKANHVDFLFNEYLKFNDGVLVKFIAKKEGISIDDAHHLVNDFVQKVKKKIEDNGEYEIEHIGVLKKEGGSLILVKKIAQNNRPDIKDEIKTELKKTGSIQISKANEDLTKKLSPKKTEVMDEVKGVDMDEDKKVLIEESVSIDQDLQKEQKVKESKPIIKNQEAQLHPPIEDSKDNPPKLNQEVHEDDSQPVKSKKGLFIGLIVGLFVVVFGTLLVFNPTLFFGDEKVSVLDKETESSDFSDELNSTTQNELEDVEDDKENGLISSESEMEQEDQILEEKVLSKTENEDNTSSTDIKEFKTGYNYIVAGSFSVKENAQKYATELMNIHDLVQVYGVHNNNYIVILGSFSDVDNARDELKKIVQVHGSAWLLKK